ncbi:MAG TPA: ComEC/Rec2 family competence protein [Mucilaginibacter sp.]|jgi:competence protein ComEC|nr:ComEC/Rec2 family competence protein [Mucilaginibacter sp.]
MIANHKGEIPVVILLLPFLSGIGLGVGLFSGTNLTGLIVSFLILSTVFIGLNLNYRRLNLHKYRWLGGSLITLILFLFGLVSVTRYNELNHPDHFSKTAAQYLVVKINNEPNAKNGLTRFTTEVIESVRNGKKSAASGTLLIATKDTNATKLYYGDELLIPARYNPIDPPFNPAEFNYKKYLANQNIWYQAFLFPKQFVVLAADQGNPIIAYSLRLRQRLVEKLKCNMRDTDAVAVASTLILGYKADLSNDILQAYSKTGTIHVLSVSGAHVAIIYILLALALGFLDRFKYGKPSKAIIIITLIWYYSTLSGFSPAVCRAAVMISMVIVGKTFSRYINTLNILAISAFLLLVYDPFFITDVGFQLSYLAVFGLIVLQPVVYNWYPFKNKWADKLWALCSVSIAAQVITFPLSAFYFHQFPVYFLISNLFIIIPTAVIMYSGIAFLLLPQIPVVSTVIAFILEKSIILMNKGLAFIEHTPFASLGKIWLATAEYILLYAIIISAFYFLHEKKVWLLKTAMACILFLCISLSIKNISLSRSNQIVWLNLKKHPGIVFRHGYRAVVLTDIKTTDKTFQYSVQPYLDSCQVSDIKMISLSQNIKTQWLAKEDNLIQFMNTRIIVFDGRSYSHPLPEKLKADYLYITGNPAAGLNEINNYVDYPMAVIDGSTSDRLLRQVANQAGIKKIDYKILKRNNSLISVSN